jgi:hypothetical protein
MLRRGSHFGGCVHDGSDDILVTGATAQHRRQAGTDFLFARRWICAEEIQGSNQHSRGAEAALKAVLLVERLLQRMQLSPFRNALDGYDIRTICLYCQHDTGARGLVIQQNCASSTDAVLTPHMSASERKFIAQVINE